MKLFWACLFSILSCTNIKKENNEPKISISENYNIVKTDSIYPNKNYRIIIDDFAKETSWNDDEYNTVFKFQKLENQEYKTLYSDSIQCHFHEILFEDFNGDDVKDILIQNISDVRSNLTYYLYLVDSENERLKKNQEFQFNKKSKIP